MERRKFLTTTSLATAALLTRYRSKEQMNKIKIGIVGTGWWGRDFLINYALACNEFDIIGICDVNQKAIELALEKIASTGAPKPGVYADYQEMYHMPGLQAVAIATPTHWHPLQFIAACEKGLDIWQEKPLSYDIRELQAMQTAHQKSKNMVNVDFPRLWSPYNNEIKDFIQSGQLGNIHQIQFNIHNTTGTAPASVIPSGFDYDAFCGPAPLVPYRSWPKGNGPAWRGQHDFSRGILVDWGIHFLENIRQVMDLNLPDSISAISSNTNPTAEHPDHQEVLFDFNGLPVQWSHKGWGFVPRQPYTNIGIFYHGSKGTLFSADAGWEVHPADGTAVREYGNPKAQPGGTDYQAGVDLVFNAQFKAFAQAIRDRSMAFIRGPFSEGLKSTAAVIYADLAIRTGNHISIDHRTFDIKDNEIAQTQLLRPYREPLKHPYLT